MKKFALIFLVLVVALAVSAQTTIQVQSSGTTVGTYKKFLKLNFTNGGCAFNSSTGAMDCDLGVTGSVALSGLANPSADKVLDMGARTLNFNFTSNFGTAWGYSISSNGANASTGYLFKVSAGAGSSNKVVSFLNGAGKGVYIDADGLVRITDQLYIAGHRFTFSDLAAGNIPIGSYYLDLAEIAAPANPAAGSCRFYVDSTTHQVVFKNSAGTSCLPASGSESYPGVISDSADGLTVTGTVSAAKFRSTGTDPDSWTAIADPSPCTDGDDWYSSTTAFTRKFCANGTAKSYAWSDHVHTGMAVTVASGTATLATDSIAANSCATAVTVSATGVATTDVISWTPNADITGVTGYTPGGTLRIYPYPTANNINFKVCNGSATDAVVPGSAVVLNWRVTR